MNFLKIISKFSLFSIFCLASFFTSNVIAENTSEKEKIEAFFEDLESFTRIFSDIKQLYVDDVTNEELFNNAIKGMVNGLDPHSVYLEPKEQTNLMESAEGQFGGLGIVIGKKDDAIQVISPIDDTPAYRAGIQAGDLIVKIGNKPVNDMALEDGVSLMRGTPNTSIDLTIVRNGKKPFVVNITREIITITSVKSHLLDSGLGYVRISSFQNPTAQLLKDKIKELVEKNGSPLKSLILDLRNNPGGILDGAVDVSNVFLDNEGLVVYTEGRIPSSNLKFPIEGPDILNGAPIVVLINEGSASASEIVAGALQDHKRAIIMGKTSFGKGSVQTIIDSENGYGLKITTARYFTPSGRSIQAKGIEPDIALKNIDLNNEKEEDITDTKEKDLEGHLEDKNPTEMTSDEIIKQQDKIANEAEAKAIERLKKDYFIVEASNLLKALNVLAKK